MQTPPPRAGRTRGRAPRRAIVAGGSIGGLFAALMLLRDGWEVSVLERARTELSGRGAGIVTHDLLIRLIRAAGASTEELGVPVQWRVAYDIDGAEIARHALPQIVTSWDRVHSSLRALLPPGAYRLGHAVAAYRETAQGVEVTTEEGATLNADLLVGADGFRSAIRAQMLPDIVPIWSGYVVWRALAAERDLPGWVQGGAFPHFGFFLPAGGQVLGYPIAGPGNDLRPGHRRYNLVWYTSVPPEHLPAMLTDTDGTCHDMTIPPPLIRNEVIAAMRETARAELSRPFRAVLAVAERPFFTPIYDHLSPVMAKGRVALVGDAACVARPHVGMGVTKAAQDAEALARHLRDAPVAEALAAFSAERVPQVKIARDTARRLGSWTFGGGGQADGRGHPHETALMLETAVVPAALQPA
jgi:2-polyprenyl-6-methoxyphenol hydroxylase-like FAD-dependent oxidoreductase